MPSCVMSRKLGLGVGLAGGGRFQIVRFAFGLGIIRTPARERTKDLASRATGKDPRLGYGVANNSDLKRDSRYWNIGST